jgi:threonyl-tRNA synthetase
LRKEHIRAKVDASSNRMGAKIRDAQMQKVPYMLVIGDREVEAETVAVRLRSEKRLGAIPVDEFIGRVQEAIKTRALE